MDEFLRGAGIFLLYIISMASLFLGARVFVKIPDELFRKLLHFVLLGAYIPLVFGFDTWWMAALLVAGLIGALYPVIGLAERIPVFSAFVNERSRGEFKSSMVLALSVMVLSTCICWGLFGDRYLVLACVYAWGVGDAFAALVGKRFGRHKLKLPFADPHKSLEGSAAMFVTSSAAVCAVLLLRGGLGVGACVLMAMGAAAVATLVELCSKDGHDTYTCPAAAMAVLLPLIWILGG